MAITVDPSQVHSIEVDPSQVQVTPAGTKTGFDGFMGQLKDGLGSFLQGVNPVKIVKDTADTIRTAATHPLDALSGIAQGNARLLDEARDAWKKGDYVAATAHGVNYLLPFGQQLDAAGTKIKDGKVGEGIGDSLALGVQLAAPESIPVRGAVKAAAGKVRNIPALFENPNQVESAAVDFANQRGIPVPAGIATGNKFVQGAQTLADHSPIGSVIAQRAKAAEAQAMTRVAGELADRAHPTAIAPAQAGRDITDALEEKISGYNADANSEYSTLREIEADPANLRTVQVGTKKIPKIDVKSGQTISGQFDEVPDMRDVALPVDLRPVKAALKPVYDGIMRQLPITQQRGSIGVKALENIINGPDHAPVSIVDQDLGTIKAAARGADLPELKTLSQGLAARAVGELHGAVTEAVAKAERTAPNGGQSGNGKTSTAAGISVPEDTGIHPGGTEQGAVGGESNRPGPASSPSDETVVTIPGQPDSRYNARYEIRDIGEIQSSHNPHNFTPNTKYPIRNDRDYGNQLNQRKIIEWSAADQFEPRYHISDNPDAVNGPPLIDMRGTVLGGNGRTMILDRVYKNNPQGADAYRQLLEERAPQFGIDPAEVRQVKNPVLVRVIDDTHLENPAAIQDAVTDFNKTGTAALTPSEQAISDARRVSQETRDAVSARLDKLGQNATMGDVLEGQHGVELMQRLIKDGVVSPQEGAKLFTKDALTADGNARIRQLMTGQYFRDASQLDNVAAGVKGKIERISAPLAHAEREPGYGLDRHVRDAVDLLEQQKVHGASTLDDYLGQLGLIADQFHSPESIELAKALQKRNPNDMTAAVRSYAEHAKYAGQYEGPGLFDLPKPLTPRQAMNDAFGSNLPPGDFTPRELSRVPQQPPDWNATEPVKAEASAVEATPLAPGISAKDEALGALAAGREATRLKYETDAVRKRLPNQGAEGRQVFDQALWTKDAGIERLRALAKQTPAEMPKLARAYLEELFGKATAEGGFSKGEGLRTQWANLGPETKQLLFPNPMLRSDLDKFFTLAKKQAQSPNPSGSALVGSIAAGVGYTLANPVSGLLMNIPIGALSWMLHSPKGVAALTKGLTVSVADKAAATIAAMRILKVAGSAAESLQSQSSQLPTAAEASPSLQNGQPAQIAMLR